MSGRQRSKKKKVVIGLTGSFGSGKSTVARIFKSFGASVCDADKIAHSCIEPGKDCYKKIVGFFGKGILGADGAIDRRKLGALVFKDKHSLKKLDSFVHPRVIGLIRKQVKGFYSRFVIIDAPLLIEAGLGEAVDKLVVVTINQKEQVKRLRKKAHLGRADILKRVRAQIPLREKERLADFIIDNSGSISKTKKQVKQVWKALNGQIYRRA